MLYVHFNLLIDTGSYLLLSGYCFGHQSALRLISYYFTLQQQREQNVKDSCRRLRRNFFSTSEPDKMANAVKFVPEHGSGAVKFVPEHGGSTGTNRIVIAVAVVVLFVAFVLFIVGVVLLSKKSCDKTSKTSALTSKHWNPKCRYSEEAMRVGLPSFLDKVKAHYYEYNPHNIAWDPDLKKDQLRAAKLYR